MWNPSGLPPEPPPFRIEPLAIAIRSNRAIQGISRYGTEHKLSLYADDLLLFVSKAEVTIPYILELFDTFGLVSGYKLNLHKSELLPLNMPLSTLANITVPFKIATHSFVYLGITVMKNFSDFFKENLYLSMQQDLSKWSRFLSR